MRRIVCFLTLGTLLTLVTQSQSQQPSPIPGEEKSPSKASSGSGDGPKVCVTEIKPTPKVVYSSTCKQYCVPHKSFHDILRSCFGHESASCGQCEMRTKNVLLKKVVDGPDAPKCILKNAPAECETCAQPGVKVITIPPQR